MKKFATPEILVEKLVVEDVITTSTCDSDSVNCNGDLGMG